MLAISVQLLSETVRSSGALSGTARKETVKTFRQEVTSLKFNLPPIRISAAVCPPEQNVASLGLYFHCLVSPEALGLSCEAGEATWK